MSFEPLLGPVAKCDLSELRDFHWGIIGAQTGPSAEAPNPEWVKNIIAQASVEKIPVFVKDNLKWPE